MYKVLNTNVHSHILWYCDMTLRRDQKEKIQKMLVLHSISFSHVTTKNSIQIYSKNFSIINLTHLTNHTISIKYKVHYLCIRME